MRVAHVVLVDGQMLGLDNVTFVQQASIPIPSVPVLRHIVLHVLPVLNHPAMLVWHVAPAGTPLQPACHFAQVVAPANTLPRLALPPRHNAKTVRSASISRTRARQNALRAEKAHMQV
jgi:hypothetical protein